LSDGPAKGRGHAAILSIESASIVVLEAGMASWRAIVGFGLAMASAGIARAQDGGLDIKALSPDGRDACFGRVYDKAHLKAHPNQKVERIFFYYGGDPVSHPNEEPGNGYADAGYNGFMTTTTRGAKRPDWVGGWCGASGEEGDGAIHCGMECDRTMASLKLDAKGRLIVSDVSQDLYLDAGAEEELGAKEYASQALGSDDDGFALDRRPAAECRAEFARIDPTDPKLGEPLRVRLKPDQPFCYGRDYTAAHLASHPEQVTQTIRVFRGPVELASYAAASAADNWPNGADIMVSVTTRKGQAKAMQSYSCDGEGDQWRCVATDKASDAGCDVSAREIYLRRGANGTMMLANPGAGLPVADLCTSGNQTASDDKVFRLDPMPQAQCGP
jgi:hypothetical protein